MSVDGSPVLTANDLLMRAFIVGCPQIGPGLKPCLKVISILFGRARNFYVDQNSMQDIPVLETLKAMTDGMVPGLLLVQPNTRSAKSDPLPEDPSGMSQEQLEALRDAADLTGILDPSPVSDGVSFSLSMKLGDWFGALMSVISMVPYLGDAIGKSGKALKKAWLKMNRARIYKRNEAVRQQIRNAYLKRTRNMIYGRRSNVRARNRNFRTSPEQVKRQREYRQWLKEKGHGKNTSNSHMKGRDFSAPSGKRDVKKGERFGRYERKGDAPPIGESPRGDYMTNRRASADEVGIKKPDDREYVEYEAVRNTEVHSGRAEHKRWSGDVNTGGAPEHHVKDRSDFKRVK
jgi:hypothetical protein